MQRFFRPHRPSLFLVLSDSPDPCTAGGEPGRGRKLRRTLAPPAGSGPGRRSPADLLAEDLHLPRRLESQAHAVPLDADHGQDDGVADPDNLANFSGQYQHSGSLSENEWTLPRPGEQWTYLGKAGCFPSVGDSFR